MDWCLSKSYTDYKIMTVPTTHEPAFDLKKPYAYSFRMGASLFILQKCVVYFFPITVEVFFILSRRLSVRVQARVWDWSSIDHIHECPLVMLNLSCLTSTWSIGLGWDIINMRMIPSFILVLHASWVMLWMSYHSVWRQFGSG